VDRNEKPPCMGGGILYISFEMDCSVFPSSCNLTAERYVDSL
jgi:hypothetical protein